MSLIFLSHSSIDELEAVALKHWLLDNGWEDVFLDLDPEHGLRAGERWQEALRRAADRCEAVVFIISPAWAKSKWCLTEFLLAKSLSKLIFGVVVKETALTELPTELTAEYQLTYLIGKGSVEALHFVHHEQAADVSFLANGLARLRLGLQTAGLSASYFPWPPQDDKSRAPYRGLEPLDAKDAAVFFGRDTEILQGLDKLRGMRAAGNELLFVILGPSGSGKSSFLRAGLLPRLARNARHFHTLNVIRPERSPLYGQRGVANAIYCANEDLGLMPVNLGEVKTMLENGGAECLGKMLHNIQNAARHRLLGLPEDAPPPTLVLPVDQAEELFSSDATEEAHSFLELIGNVLRTSLSDSEGTRLSLIVAFTIRSDRYDPLQTAQELMGLKTVVFDALKPMPRVQFKEIIKGPAIRASLGGKKLEVMADLVDQLLLDCEQGADTLPLLSLTLSRIYRDYSSGGDLRLDQYKSMGGMAKVIKTEVESILSSDPGLRKAQLDTLHAAFIPWLATVNPENNQPVRRRARMTDLPPASHVLICALIEKRLLLSDMREDEQVVEVAHESLLRQWPILVQWLEMEGDELKEADRLEQAATAWKMARNHEDWLFGGERLAISEALAAKPGYRRRLESTSEFLLASRQREIKRWEEEERPRKDALAGELVATADDHAKDLPDQSLLLGLAAWRISAIPDANAFVRFARANYRYKRLLRHEDQVYRSQFSPDGKTMVTASEDKTARLWDVASGTELQVLRGHEDLVYRAQFSPDGKTVVTASGDKTARLWDAASGSQLQVLHGHEYGIVSAQFSPDGKTVVTASLDNTARLWDATSGRELHVLRGHEKRLYSAQFSPDGRTVVTASDDNTARLWDAASGKVLHVLRGHENEVNSAQFSPDGKTVVTASDDNTARLWDATSGRELHVLRGHEKEVRSTKFSRDGKSVVTASLDNTARLWDAASGRELQVLRGHESWVVDAQFSPDGKTVVTASYDGTARLWDTASGRELHVARGHEREVTSAQFSPDGKTVVTASYDGTARLWDAASGRELQVLRGHERKVNSAQFSPDGKTVVTASDDNTARLWDATSGRELHVLRGHERKVNSAQFSPDGKTVAAASDDNTARLWDAASGKVLHVLRGHENEVNSAQFSPDGKTVATASDDNTARLWDAASGRELQILRGHEKEVRSAKFSSDGKTVVTASRDDTARLWDAASGRELQVLRGHELWVMDAQFSPDGKTVATASWDQTARLWDAAGGRELHVLRGHNRFIFSAQFSPDGKTVLTASQDPNARLWDAASGKELHVLRGHEGSIVDSQFSPDGKTVVTASADETARLWDAASGRELQVLRGHEKEVIGAQFSPDGKTVLTASWDETARLWFCWVCRPANEIAIEMTTTIGRGLTEEEQRRFGLKGNKAFSLSSLFPR